MTGERVSAKIQILFPLVVGTGEVDLPPNRLKLGQDVAVSFFLYVCLCSYACPSFRTLLTFQMGKASGFLSCMFVEWAGAGCVWGRLWISWHSCNPQCPGLLCKQFSQPQLAECSCRVLQDMLGKASTTHQCPFTVGWVHILSSKLRELNFPLSFLTGNAWGAET